MRQIFRADAIRIVHLIRTLCNILFCYGGGHVGLLVGEVGGSWRGIVSHGTSEFCSVAVPV